MSSFSAIYERPWIPAPIEELVFCDERIVVVEGAIKAAKTTTAMLWLAERAMRSKAGRHHWWVSSTYKTAEIAFERLCRGLPRRVFHANESDMTIELQNEVILDFKSAEKPGNLYGQDVYSAVADEASRWREDAFHAVYSTLTATNGLLRVLHNVKGRNNWAYRLARRAESGEPGMRHGVFTTYDAVAWGLIDQETVELARRDLPEAVLNELYLCVPADDGGNPFGVDSIGHCVAPLSIAPAVCYGVDLGRAEDYTVVIGVDAEGAVCVFERWYHTPWPETESRIARLTSRVPTLVDSTGVGDRVFVAPQALGRHFEPYVFTQTSKQRLMEGLAVAIQQGKIHFPDGPIRQELETFEYEYTRTGVRYSAPSGLHDDCVCALALADYRRSSLRPVYSVNRCAVGPPRQLKSLNAIGGPRAAHAWQQHRAGDSRERSSAERTLRHPAEPPRQST